MGTYYSFDYWVPRENLLFFFTCVIAHADDGVIERSYFESPASFYRRVSFTFEADEALHEYAQHNEEYYQRHFGYEAARRELTSWEKFN